MTEAIKVTVLSQPDCRFCDIADAVLDQVGHDHRLVIRRVDLDSDEGRELAARNGIAFAPGILLDGEMFSYGRLSERRLRRHLERAARSPGDAPDLVDHLR